MDLPEDGRLARSLPGSPLPDTSLEGATVGIEEPARMLLAKPLEERLGLEPRLLLQFGFDLCPDFGERIDAGAVSAWRLFADAGKSWALAVLTRRCLGHPCPLGRMGQWGSLFEQTQQLADLAIRDHRRPPSLWELPITANCSQNNSNCLPKPLLIVADQVCL